MPLTAAVREDIMKHFFGLAAWTAPTGIYLSLHTAEPNSSGSSERPTTGGYARLNATGLWTVGSDGTTTINGPVYFPQATANWGTITHVGLWSAATGGTFLGYVSLAASVVINSGSRFYLPDDALSGVFETSSLQGFAPVIAEKIAKHLFGVALWTMNTPKARWMSLHTVGSAPLASGTLGAGAPSGGSYARVDLNGKIAAGSVDGTVVNTGEILFPQATANWGTIGTFGLYETSNAAANAILFSGQLLTPVDINNTNVASFPANELSLTLG